MRGEWIGYGVLLVLLVGCTYRLTDENWEKNGLVRLTLNWQGNDRPEDMTYYFYKDGADRPIIRQGKSSGYEGTLPAGSYEVAVCAADPESVLLDMDKGYAKACGLARQVSALKSADIEVAQPAYLYGTGDDLGGVKGFRAVVRELYPVSLTRILELNIKLTGREGEPVADLTGLLTGVASGVNIPTGELLFDTPAFMVFDTQPVSPGVYTSSLNLFGAPGSGQVRYKDTDLYLTLKFEDGLEVTSSTDITEAIDKAFETTLSVRIVLDLEIAYDEINGMVITTTGWQGGTGEVVAP